jgi:RimJ/RimL family protein N-acetyltransferase
MIVTKKTTSRKISIFIKRIKVSIRDFGVKHTISRGILDVILGKIVLFRKYIIYEKDLPPSSAPELRNPDIQFSFLSANDKELIEKIEDLSAISRELITERISGGGYCIVAKNKNNVVGFNLVSVGRSRIRFLDVFLNLADTEAWSEQITVSLEYRRGGLASDLRHLMFSHLADRGFSKLIGGYVPFNVKSGLLAKKLGFVETERITLLRIFGWEKIYRQSLLPGQAPALSIDTK